LRKSNSTIKAEADIINNSHISINGIRSFLANPEFSESIYIYESLNSTNEKAKTARRGVHIALEQSSGKGRHGKSFYSPSGGIYMSAVLRNCQLPTLAAAVVVCNAVESVTGKTCRIKWVNDIFLDGEKICGILTEAAADSIIVGIGINVVSNGEYAGIYDNCDNCVPENTHNRIIAYIINAITGDKWLADVIDEYKKRCFVLGHQVKYGDCKVVAVDIDQMGRLIVKKPDAALETLSSGEISIKL